MNNFQFIVIIFNILLATYGINLAISNMMSAIESNQSMLIDQIQHTRIEGCK